MPVSPRRSLRFSSLVRTWTWLLVGFLGCLNERSAERTNTSPTQALSPADAPRQTSAPLTLDSALERADVANPQIHALRAALEVAQQRHSAATDIRDPEAVASWGSLGDDVADPISSRNGKQEQHAGLRFFLPNPFLMVPQAKARSSEVMASRAELQAAQWQVEADVRRAFEELQYLTEDVALAGQLARDLSLILQDARTRAEQGAATASDVVTAAEKRLEAENALESSRHRYQLARRELAGLMDAPPESVQITTNAFPQTKAPAQALRGETLETIALRHRGELAALHWRALAAQSAYRQARNARVPWLSEVTGGNRQPANDWWVGVEMTIPVFSWTKNHNENVLQAQAKLAGVNETNEVQLIRRELRNALDEVNEQEHVHQRHDQEIAPLISQMRQTLGTLKAAPNLMSSQITATEAQLLEVSRLELAASWQYRLALLNLERVLGAPLAAVVPALERHP